MNYCEWMFRMSQILAELQGNTQQPLDPEFWPEMGLLAATSGVALLVFAVASARHYARRAPVDDEKPAPQSG